MKSEWFFPGFAPYEKPYEKVGLLIKNRIFSGKSTFQKLEVVNSYKYGKILFLDGVIQTTEKDEYFYHEMMVHIPLIYHGNAEKVLIIGGGDGGVLKEVLKHSVKEAWLVEIDKDVIEITKKYMPSVCGNAFKDKRSNILIEDGLKFVKNYKNYFDIVILDLTDPSGPSKFLYSTSFYKNIHKALKKDGLLLTQSGVYPSMTEGLEMVRKNLKSVFPFIKTHLGLVPSFGVGLNSYTLGSRINLDMDLKIIQERFQKLGIDTKYYSPEIHLSSGILPKNIK